MLNIIKIIQQNQKIKTSVFLINDLLISLFASYLALVLRFDSFNIDTNIFFVCSILSVISYLPLVISFKIYYQLQRFFSFNFIKFYSQIFIYYFFILTSMIILINLFTIIPRSFSFIQTTIFFLIFIFNRYLLTQIINKGTNLFNYKYSIIYGSHNNISRLINFLPSHIKVKAIILTDQKKIKLINGINIFQEKDIIEIIEKYNIDTFILAKDEYHHFNYNKFIKILFDYNISFLEFYNDNLFNISSEINIGALLFRNEIYKELQIDLFNKSIIITGGAGSIGSEIFFQVLTYGPREIIILDNSEFNLFLLNQKIKNLKHYTTNSKITLKLVDISNIDELDFIIANKKIDHVFHCAAYKHVPIVEENLFTGIKNNFLFTHNLFEFLLKKNIKSITLISSDKAVRPTNIMGATKRLAELSALYFNKINGGKAIISIVRFGNVLESSGSVVPEFKNQILKGGPVTVTHKEITRYFMSLEEAALLVIQSSQISKGGEIFLLDMGKPIKIYDLAKKMIRLFGRSVKNFSNKSGEIEIIFTGLRPGEKLYEELLIDDNAKASEQKFIYRSIENEIEPHNYELIYNDIKKFVNDRDVKNILLVLKNKFIDYRNNETH